MEDGSSIRIKAARHLVKEKHQGLKSAKLKINDSALPQSASQLPPLGRSTGGPVPWENVLKVFRDKWYKEQKEYEASNQAERRWDNKGVPIFPPEYCVAIIGAGVAGLRTAMLLQSMHIPYKIFEASNRPGGRLFTYHFLPRYPKGKHDYYDVGGMRFPNNKANEETFKLFKELDLSRKLIKYVLSNDHNILLYNDIKDTVKNAQTQGDHFDDREFVPEEYLEKEYTDSWGRTSFGVDACTAAAYDPFRKALIGDFKTGWDKLMKYDWASTRSYLAQGMDPKYPLPVVHWMETRDVGTGGFDRAFAEDVLDSLEFDDPTKDVDWHCLDGGSELLINAMLAELEIQPSYNYRVTSIEPDSIPHSSDHTFPLMRVSATGRQDELFTHVVSTTTFANLRTINTAKVRMTYKQRQAIRAFNYGAAVKVAIKFKTRWWEKNGRKHFGGSSYTDRQSRVVVYPSAGLGEEGPGVLMVSYAWGQDAARFGALIAESDWTIKFDPGRTPPPSEEVLLEQIYEDLAVMHGVTVEYLRDEKLDYHAFNWYHNQFTMGAYAHFSPGQFKTFFPDIVKPAGHGRFHFAGEVASHHHAWVAGALDSAKRAVAEILRLDFPFLIPKYRKESGMSLVFEDEERSEEEFLSGLFSKELEDVGYV